MKRSQSMVLTSLMVTGGLSLGACDGPSAPAGQSGWLNGQSPPAASAPGVQGAAYANLQACLNANVVDDAACNTAYQQAQAETPKFNDRQTCEQRYGVDQCVPRNEAGGSFFTPLLTGFIVGQALNNLGGRGYYGVPGRYDRDRFDSRGYSGGGYGGGRDYVTGRRGDSYDAPARVQSRSAVISRGGFGGGYGGFGG